MITLSFLRILFCLIIASFEYFSGVYSRANGKFTFRVSIYLFEDEGTKLVGNDIDKLPFSNMKNKFLKVLNGQLASQQMDLMFEIYSTSVN